MNISKNQVESVVKILKNNEDRLSDGYDHYCGYDEGDVDGVLREVARKILTILNEEN